MGWFGKGLSRGGIVPHGRGDDPEPRAVGLPALPDGYWFVVKRSGDAVRLSVERGGWFFLMLVKFLTRPRRRFGSVR